jgi:hypothetical protein
MGVPAFSQRSPRVLLLLLVLAVVALIVVGVVATSREGPNVSLTGRVTTVELHRLCISHGESESTCIQVEAPPEIDDISVGECVTVIYSPEEILVSVQEASGC